MSKNASGTSAKKPDDLKAVRTIKNALEGFESTDRERIIRWARESLGLGTAAPAVPPASPPVRWTAPSAPTPTPAAPTPAAGSKDILTFVNQKNPQTDIQLATTIAYYYRYEAPEGDRKEEIDAAALRDACRLAGRPGKLVRPLATLNNAQAKGLLDRGSTRGMFAINSVGENLVGMTLPGNAAQPDRPRNRGPKKAARKKVPKKNR
jgi:hypothetical protein